MAGWKSDIPNDSSDVEPVDSTNQSSSDSSTSESVTDSTQPLGLSDSSRASVGEISDSLEDCQHD
jgi:hypothetical protein